LFYDFGIKPRPVFFGMLSRLILLVVAVSTLNLYSQTIRRQSPRVPLGQNAAPATPIDDELNRHLSAAQGYQLAGDL